MSLTGFDSNTTSKHGFHVHKEGKLGNKCKDAEGHYNPKNKQHGGPDDEERYVSLNIDL